MIKFVKNIKLLKSKKGMTLIELLVAMGVFAVVMTIAVGSYVSILRFQAQSETMTAVQQNGRIALEQLTRLARQAEELKVTDNSDLDEIKIGIGDSETCYKVESEGLKKYNSCGASGFSITDKDVMVKVLSFELESGLPSALKIKIVMAPKGSTDAKEELNLETKVLLTGLK